MLPEHISVILLSATVPNAMEFADWIGYVCVYHALEVCAEYFFYIFCTRYLLPGNVCVCVCVWGGGGGGGFNACSLLFGKEFTNIASIIFSLYDSCKYKPQPQHQIYKLHFSTNHNNIMTLPLAFQL